MKRPFVWGFLLPRIIPTLILSPKNPWEMTIWCQPIIDDLPIQENHRKEEDDGAEDTKRTCATSLPKATACPAELAAHPSALHSLGSATLTATIRNLHRDITPNHAAGFWQGAAGNSRAGGTEEQLEISARFPSQVRHKGHWLGLCSFSRRMLTVWSLVGLWFGVFPPPPFCPHYKDHIDR